MPYADLSLGKLFYQVADFPAQQGIKGTLVLIHGAGGNHQRWEKQLGMGIPGWRLVALDLPGHGASGGSAADNVSDYADAVAELIRQKEFPRPCVLTGHSLGGAIALATALAHPALVDGLVLMGSGARLPVNPKMLEQLAAGSFDLSFLKIAYSPEFPSDLLQQELDLWRRASQQQLFKDFSACDRYDVSEKLASLKIPVLILVGDQDKMTPVKSSQFLNQNIPGSTLCIIAGAGHHLMLEKPAETNQVLGEFLARSFSA